MNNEEKQPYRIMQEIENLNYDLEKQPKHVQMDPTNPLKQRLQIMQDQLVRYKARIFLMNFNHLFIPVSEIQQPINTKYK